MLRILIDTNILIPLEDTHSPVPSMIADFIRLGTTNCAILVHPRILQDIANDRDAIRREIMLSKIRKYEALKEPPLATNDFLNSLGVNYEQPIVDDHLLYALHRNCVHILVTEDKGIHTKARKLGLDSSVYSVKDCLSLFQSLFGYEEAPLSPFVEDVPLYHVNISDPLFDSLREDYSEFNEWFAQKCREGRHAWIVRSGPNIQGICIYKEEAGKEEDLCNGSVLKMCTFKIREDTRGEKIGELLLKTVFQYCRDREYEGAYLTVFPKHTGLIDFCNEFGFEDRGSKRGSRSHDEEHTFYKSFAVPKEDRQKNAYEYYKTYWPFLRGDVSVNKFIVPVKPHYHETLFPEVQDIIQRQLRLSNLAVSNAIRKAYICKAKTKDIKPGDLLLFYRSEDLQKITTLGIVEHARWVHEEEDIISLAGKRTVFSITDIKQKYSGGALVVLFREIEHLAQFISPRAYGLPYPQRIQKIPQETFLKIIELRRNKGCLMA